MRCTQPPPQSACAECGTVIDMSQLKMDPADRQYYCEEFWVAYNSGIKVVGWPCSSVREHMKEFFKYLRQNNPEKYKVQRNDTQ